jgi:hypothetical protein
VQVTPTFDFANQAPFSLEAWVKPEADGDGAYSSIVAQSVFTNGWGLYAQYAGGVIRFARVFGANDQNYQEYTGPLPRDRFTHLVGTYDGATMHLYVNGLDVSSVPPVQSTRAIAKSPEPIVIGTRFPGILDDVAVYDHALPAERVRTHHQKGVGM